MQKNQKQKRVDMHLDLYTLKKVMLYQQSDDDHVTGSFDKEAVYDKKYSKKIYICQNNLIASVVVETGGCCMVWIRLPYIYILTTDSDILSKEFFPHMHFSADSF